MRIHLLWLLAACHSEAPKSPVAAITPGPVAIGAPLVVETTWVGSCESGFLAGAHFGGGESHATGPCHDVAHTVTITCDDNMCTSSPLPDGRWQVVPTRIGRLIVHATVHPTGGKKAQTVHLAPVEVKLPDTARARCNLWHDDTAQVDVFVASGQTELVHAAEIKVDGGEACRMNAPVLSLHDPGSSRYSCPIRAQTAKLTVSTKDYALPATTDCKVVLPTPELGADTTIKRFVLNRATSSQNRADFARITHARLAKWGWKEASTTEGADETTIAANKLGSTVEIEIAESKGPEFVIYTWSYKVTSGQVIGITEVPGWYATTNY